MTVLPVHYLHLAANSDIAAGTASIGSTSSSTRLEVLGDGSQSKPYLYVGDLVEAVLIAWDRAPGPLAVYHAAGIGETSVREIVEMVVAAAGCADTQVVYGTGDRGWPGDVPRCRYDTSRLQALGWRPRRHSTDAVRHAIERILANAF